MSAPVLFGACTPEAMAEIRRAALSNLIVAYGGSKYRLLVDLGDILGLSVAYVDRQAFEAHIERDLTAGEWSRVNEQFRAMDFDDHVGDTGRCRTEWIDTILAKGGVNPDQDETDDPAQVDHVDQADEVAALDGAL